MHFLLSLLNISGVGMHLKKSLLSRRQEDLTLMASVCDSKT
jgi:hypothetical protein